LGENSTIGRIIEGLRERTEKFHNYETEKITRKASDAAIELFGSSIRDRHAYIVRRYMRRRA